MATRINQALIDTLQPPSKGYHLTFDDDVRGLAVRITAKGTIAFVMDYRSSGRQRRMTIGTYPEWKPARARKRAEEIRREIQNGNDPMADRHAQREAPAVIDLWERYKEEHIPKKRSSSQANDTAIATRDILPRLGKMKVADVRFTDVDILHRKISKRAPIVANRAAALLSKMFNLSIKWEWRTDNPAKGIERNQENKRERFLSLDEIDRLSRALTIFAQYSDRPSEVFKSVSAIRLLILTGARKSEVLSARWDQFDLAKNIWVKPSAHTKQKKEHRVPISAPALEVLQSIKEKQENLEPRPEWLFPSPGTKLGHVTEIKRTWTTVCEIAEIIGVRIHDLRHSFASILVSGGASLPMIGSLLGHTQTQTTARYAHLFDEPLRAATERVGSLMSAKGGAEIVDTDGRLK